jgi:two-component system chemotaxis response regulator CheB
MTNAPWLVVIAASAGGIPAIGTVLRGLPPQLPAAVVIVQHRSARVESILEQILTRRAHLPVMSAVHDASIEAGRIYVARADLHLTITPGRRFAYIDGTRVNYVLSSANPLFQSAAQAFQNRVIGVVLTGGGSDATDGVQAVKQHGGIVIVQDPETAESRGMPTAAIRAGVADYVLPLATIAPTLVAIVSGLPAERLA